MASTTLVRFKERGLSGIALIALGITLGIMFNKSSAWPTEAKTIALAVAQVSGAAGAAFFTSYVNQLTFRQMRTSLISLSFLTGLVLFLTL